VNRHSKSLTVLDGGPVASAATPAPGGGETAAVPDAGAPDESVVAQASFDMALPVVAAGAGGLLLVSAAFLIVVLRRRRKADGGGADQAWALD